MYILRYKKNVFSPLQDVTKADFRYCKINAEIVVNFNWQDDELRNGCIFKDRNA